jgi:DNA-binding PucR family transcriptional regulator
VLVPLVLHGDPELGRELATRVLSPLRALPEATAERLAETLEVWLGLHGARAAVADQLHVHPQTVRYRLGQLRELFGEALDEPEQRFALMLALRLRRGVLGTEPEGVRPGIEPTPD